VIHGYDAPPAAAGGTTVDRTDHLRRARAAHERETDMYDMYPDWGPAKHDPEHPLHRGTTDALQAALNRPAGTALRDDDRLRPDDN